MFIGGKLLSKSEAKSPEHAGTDCASSGGMRVGLLAAMMFLATRSVASAASSSGGEVPFEHRGGLIWVKVSVPQSAEPLNFLLDTGAGVSVVNLRTVEKLGVRFGQRVEVRGVGSSTDGFWPQRLQATASGVALPKECLAVDLAELSRACACGVDGLLGADFFKDPRGAD